MLRKYKRVYKSVITKAKIFSNGAYLKRRNNKPKAMQTLINKHKLNTPTNTPNSKLDKLLKC